MIRRAWNLVAPMLLFAGFGAALGAQVLVQTPLPTVTADNESWYLNGEPITFAGNSYYPTGAQVFFNSSEMVRSGFYGGIPLYARTTLEPYSVVFVPLRGGRLQPYQRPRTGELTGTAGSTPTTLATPPETVPPAGLAPQAAGPPSQTTQMLEMHLPLPSIATASTAVPPATEAPATVGTAGRTPAPLHTQIGGAPQGTNSIYVEYAGERWYPSGVPQAIDASRLTRLSDYEGFPVWGDAVEPTRIYIPPTVGSPLAVEYTRQRPASR